LFADLGETGDRPVVQPEVEDRVHHARHRGACTRAHRDQQRVRRIAEATSDDALDLGQRRLHLAFELGRVFALMRVEMGADLGRDREARRNGKPEIAHLREIGALAAEQVAHLGAPVALALAEAVDPFRHDYPVSLRCA
jgi:hypothetical protein